MVEDVPLPPREYTVWLFWHAALAHAHPALPSVRAALERDLARLEAWLDREALFAMEFRIGAGDVAERQGRWNEHLRGVLRAIVDEVPETSREEVQALIEHRGFLPSAPFGSALVGSLAREISDAAGLPKPPRHAPRDGLLARRRVRVSGVVAVREIAFDRGDGAPSPSAVRALRDAVRADAKAWKQWCNILALHPGWETKQLACLRGVVPALPREVQPEISAWLDARGWFGTRASFALRGRMRVVPTGIEVTSGAIERR